MSLKENTMGKMSYIHHLCEKNDRKGLIEEVGIEMADGFLEAHRTMRKERENIAFKNLNKIVDESLKTDIDTAKKEGKGLRKDLSLLFKDIQRMN